MLHCLWHCVQQLRTFTCVFKAPDSHNSSRNCQGNCSAQRNQMLSKIFNNMNKNYDFCKTYCCRMSAAELKGFLNFFNLSSKMLKFSLLYSLQQERKLILMDFFCTSAYRYLHNNCLFICK